jgi:hypothetical protein
MQKIIDDLTSPEWWFSIVIVAILVGLVGVYLSRFLDGTGKRLANLFAARSKEALRIRAARTRLYVANPDLVPFLVAKYHAMQGYTTGLMICASFSLGVASFARANMSHQIPPNVADLIVGTFLLSGAIGWCFVIGTMRKASGYLLVMLEVEDRLLNIRAEASKTEQTH